MVTLWNKDKNNLLWLVFYCTYFFHSNFALFRNCISIYASISRVGQGKFSGNRDGGNIGEIPSQCCMFEPQSDPGSDEESDVRHNHWLTETSECFLSCIYVIFSILVCYRQWYYLGDSPGKWLIDNGSIVYLTVIGFCICDVPNHLI